MISIVSWNVNSIRSRLPHLIDFVQQHNPDIICLQETKVEDDKFPYLEIEDMGYNIATNGQKSYNGVAILSKFPLDDVVISLPPTTATPLSSSSGSIESYQEDNQARYIESVICMNDEIIRVVNIYVPNGGEVGSDKFAYKLEFLDRLYNRAQELMSYEEKLIIAGDYNIAPSDIDVYAPEQLDGSVCFHPEERKRFYRLQNIGLIDAYRILHPNVMQFSWWDYRGNSWKADKGLRIDHILLSPEACDYLYSCDIITEEREKERPSDHAPVVVNLNI